VAHWEDVLETMDALGIERAALVGSSFGGAVALRAAAVAPERISSLALFSAGAVPEPDPSPELLAVWEAEEAALEAGDHETAVAAVVAAWVRPQAHDAVQDRIAAIQRRNYERHAGEESEFAPDPLEENPAMLAAIASPVLLAAGEEDMVDFKDALTVLDENLPSATTALIPNCGHLAPLEAPEEFRRLVLSRP
jgi:pimeloyl-ACP methyl ester carboxylesterase